MNENPYAGPEPKQTEIELKNTKYVVLILKLVFVMSALGTMVGNLLFWKLDRILFQWFGIDTGI